MEYPSEIGQRTERGKFYLSLPPEEKRQNERKTQKIRRSQKWENFFMSLLISGSAAFDSIETPFDRREKIIGGSGVHAAFAASFFTPVRLVGVAGGDWPESNTRLLQEKGIETEGLEIRPNEKTLHWSGRYFENMNDRETLDIQLNVAGKGYEPVVPDSWRDTEYIFLANNSPAGHLAILRQMKKTAMVIADTMDFYINNSRDELMELLGKIDGLVLNDSEVKLLTGESNLVAAAKKTLNFGPQFVIVKKGEHGAMVVGRSTEILLIPAYPTEQVVDPTGAGDSFAGGLMGYLAAAKSIDFKGFKKALAYATVTASFNVEGFSLERYLKITREDIDQRYEDFRRMVAF